MSGCRCRLIVAALRSRRGHIPPLVGMERTFLPMCQAMTTLGTPALWAQVEEVATGRDKGVAFRARLPRSYQRGAAFVGAAAHRLVRAGMADETVEEQAIDPARKCSMKGCKQCSEH